MHYGYGPGIEGWKPERESLLRARITALVAEYAPEAEARETGLGSGHRNRPYVDRAFDKPVAIRRMTHMPTADAECLVKRADRIYREVMMNQPIVGDP